MTLRMSAGTVKKAYKGFIDPLLENKDLTFLPRNIVKTLYNAEAHNATPGTLLI